jgi:hypothetical protein
VCRKVDVFIVPISTADAVHNAPPIAPGGVAVSTALSRGLASHRLLAKIAPTLPLEATSAAIGDPACKLLFINAELPTSPNHRDQAVRDQPLRGAFGNIKRL